MILARPFWPLLILLLSLPAPVSAVVFVSSEINTTPSPDSFSICFNHSCQMIVQLSLKANQWNSIRQLFQSKSTSAAEERDRIGQAIAKLETYVGVITGTHSDKGRNESTTEPGDYRMDCIDESTNTTTYLFMMQQENLLKWHQLKEPVTRGFFFFGWPHTTAVIQENNQKFDWAVDSWFHDNGVAPEIIPLSQWQSGWSPERQ